MPYRAKLGVPERPVTPFHFTVEPPGSPTRLGDLDHAQLHSVSTRLRELADALGRVHGCAGFNVFVNDGRYGAQSTGEVPEEDRRLRFHVLGRRGDEAVAPTTILYAPEQFPLERITDAERTARLEPIETAIATGPANASEATTTAADTGTPDATGAPGGTGTPDATGTAGSTANCSLCDAADDNDTAHPPEVLRGDTARVVRPQRPLTPTHVLLTPLRHVTHLAECTHDEFVGLFRLFDRVVATFGQVHGCTSYNLSANDGKVAGQHVPHLHVHVFGRSEGEETDPYELLRGLRFNLRR